MPKKSYELVLNTMGQNRTQGFAIPLQLRRDNQQGFAIPLQTCSYDVTTTFSATPVFVNIFQCPGSPPLVTGIGTTAA